jgi:hypothetical protein
VLAGKGSDARIWDSLPVLAVVEWSKVDAKIANPGNFGIDLRNLLNGKRLCTSVLFLNHLLFPAN